jgi:four helix bundle protein
MVYRSFEDLDVWKRSCQLAVSVYALTRHWKDYGLKNQLERASVSIASNIAEGSERGGKDFIRFLRIAAGSAAEVRTQIYIAKRIKLVNEDDFASLIDEAKGISKMLSGLIKSLS